MILPFSTQLNGKPTFFVERIHKGIRDNYMLSPVDPSIHYPNEYNYFKKSFLLPKVHSIRNDNKGRWNPGVNIHFFINTRKKNMFQFAPVLPVVSIQTIEFRYKENSAAVTCLDIKFDRICTIFIDGKFYGDAYLMNSGQVVSSSYTIEELANNDGFDKVEDLFGFFNKDFKGKIIHWTDYKY